MSSRTRRILPRAAIEEVLQRPSILTARATGYVETPADVWSVQDSVIACKGEPKGVLRSKYLRSEGWPVFYRDVEIKELP